MANEQVFVGFGSEPLVLADTIRTAAERIDQLPDVRVRTWEGLRIGGNILLERIEEAILSAKVSIFDLTQLNENVLFEFGFAVGADRIVWPLRDSQTTQGGVSGTRLGSSTPSGKSALRVRNIYMRPSLRNVPTFRANLCSARY